MAKELNPVGFVFVAGGRTWRKAQVASGAGVTAVRFVNRTHGAAVGQRGVAFFTLDGGHSWDSAVSCTSLDLFDLSIDSTGTRRGGRAPHG